MKQRKETKICKSSILFYIASVAFLGIASFYFVVTYQSVQVLSQQTQVQFLDILNAYFSNCAPFFAYAFICYGIGLVLSKIQTLNSTLWFCMDDAIEEVKDVKEEQQEEKEVEEVKEVKEEASEEVVEK